MKTARSEPQIDEQGTTARAKPATQPCHKRPTSSHKRGRYHTFPPPAPGQTIEITCKATLDFWGSTDGGLLWQEYVGPYQVVMKITGRVMAEIARMREEQQEYLAQRQRRAG